MLEEGSFLQGGGEGLRLRDFETSGDGQRAAAAAAAGGLGQAYASSALKLRHCCIGMHGRPTYQPVVMGAGQIDATGEVVAGASILTDAINPCHRHRHGHGLPLHPLQSEPGQGPGEVRQRHSEQGGGRAIRVCVCVCV